MVDTVDLLQKAIQNPNKALSVLKYKTLGALGISNVRPFIVLSRSRTGSNMLISFLRSHPNIFAAGEILSNLDGRNHKEVLAEAFAAQSYLTKASGFKLFYYHPQDDDSGDLWEDLVNRDDLYVIHLKRRNILRILISRKIAEAQGLWIANNGPGLDSHKDKAHSDKRVCFTVEELANGFQQTRAWESTGDEMFSEHPLMTVYYEDLVDKPETSFRSITDFLGVPFMELQTSLRKQNPERICDLITNFEEMRDAFTGTEWQSFFEE